MLKYLVKDDAAHKGSGVGTECKGMGGALCALACLSGVLHRQTDAPALDERALSFCPVERINELPCRRSRKHKASL